MRHELIGASGPEEYWESWMRRTERSDWQFCADVFIAHLTTASPSSAIPCSTGSRSTSSAPEAGRGYDLQMFGDEADLTARMMWESTSNRALSRAPLLAFGPEKGEAMRAISRRQAIVESRPFRGNTNHPLLLWYATRTFRGVSLGPQQVFGASAPTYTPVCHPSGRQRRAGDRPDRQSGARASSTRCWACWARTPRRSRGPPSCRRGRVTAARTATVTLPRRSSASTTRCAIPASPR